MKELTARIIMGVILALLAIAVVYLAFSFIAWEFNPQHWDGAGRFAFIVCSLFAGGAGFIAPFDLVKP